MPGPGFLSRARTSILSGGNHLTAISFDELAYLASAPAITLCSYLSHFLLITMRGEHLNVRQVSARRNLGGERQLYQKISLIDDLSITRTGVKALFCRAPRQARRSSQRFAGARRLSAV
jgi:hypothetical protein